MTVRMILEDDKDEEGDIQQDGGGWIEELLLGENGTDQLPRAPHPCSAVSRCLVSAH